MNWSAWLFEGVFEVVFEVVSGCLFDREGGSRDHLKHDRRNLKLAAERLIFELRLMNGWYLCNCRCSAGTSAECEDTPNQVPPLNNMDCNNATTVYLVSSCL